MQYLYSYLHFFSALLFLTLGIVIIVRDYSSRLNQACAGIMFCFFLWSFSTVWVQHPATSEATARSFGNVAAFGWLFFNTFHLWFAWLYTKRKPLRFMKSIITLFFMLPGVLVWLQWTQSVFVAEYQRRSYGWFTPWEPTWWSPFYFIYLATMTITSFWLIFDFGRKSDNSVIRRQSVIIIATGTISLISGFLCNVFFTLLIPEGFPAVGDVTSLLWAAGLTYVAIRYNMLNITPFIAASRIITTMKDLLFLLDTHGYVISVNGAAQRVLGCQTHQVNGRFFGELIGGGQAQRTIITDAMRRESEYTAETILSCYPGPAIPVELSTSLIPGTGIVCVAHDISLQKQRTESLQEAKKQLESRVSQATEELRQINAKLLREIGEKVEAVDALKESEERFRIIFESAPDGIYLVDREGNFVDGNHEALRIVGYTKDAVAGRNFLKSGLLSKEDAGVLAEMISAPPDAAPSGYREFTLKRTDGAEIPVETIAHQLKIGEKSLNVCIVRDLSQRKKGEKEAEELRVALHHSQKMDAVGRLAGGIAHDFNNLLGGIIGYAGLVQKRLSPHFYPEAEILGKIIDVAKQAADRTIQLLAFARKGKYTIEAVNMHTVINEVIHLMRHTIDPKIVLTFLPGAEGAQVNGDRSQLHSAILNLGVNARDALPDGGTIEVSTENIPGSELPFTDVLVDRIAGRYLKIIVKDDGIGMDEATASRVFEPFFSTKEEGKGTGLGLPSVYGTVKQHGGYINLATQPGIGTSFVLYLPVIEGAAIPENPDERRPERGDRCTGTILVVDDTQLIREMMVEALHTQGYSVHACEDGTAALKWYRANHAACDLVILDYAMPGLNGKECFLAMKEIDPEVQAIIASGYAVDGEIEKTLKAGACVFLQKPFEVDEMLIAVEEILTKG